MESEQSKNLMFLNQEYIDLKYSSIYQKAIKKQKIISNIKNGGIKYILHYIRWKTHNTGSKYYSDRETTTPTVGYGINSKIVVYTCITGNYDSIKEPLYVNDKIDYYIITDMNVPSDSVWKKIDINSIKTLQEYNAADKNRFVKFFPNVIFPQYDYSIYIDGVIQIVADLEPIVEDMGKCLLGVHRHNARNCIYDEAKAIIYAKRAPKDKVLEQTTRYKNEGYPQNNGLYENTILIRKHNDISCINLMKAWWEEYMISCKRDQLSLPYIIWKNKFNYKDIYIIGNNLDKNPRFKRTYKHSKR